MKFVDVFQLKVLRLSIVMEEINIQLDLLNESVQRVNMRLDIMERKIEKDVSVINMKVARKFETMDRKFADMNRTVSNMDRIFAAMKLSSRVSKNILEGSMCEVGRYFRGMDQRVSSIEHLMSDNQDARQEQPCQDRPCYAQETGDAIELRALEKEEAQRGLFIFYFTFTGFR